MSTKSKVLFLDIETSPNLAYVWGKWQQDVIAYKEEWQILSYAYKWQGTAKISCTSQRTFGSISDKDVVKSLWKLLNSADIVIAHNGDVFDLKKANTRFLFYNLPPTRKYASVDTLKIARKYFKFNSNKLNDLGEHLGLGSKLKHQGFAMWLGCMSGEAKSWKLMEKYNMQDVSLLEKIYLRLLPWAERHPNIALIEGVPGGCNKCGSSLLTRDGFNYTATVKKQVWACSRCGGHQLTSYKVPVSKRRLS